jgi:integrase/recombinase XerC/integrase/recombinase XerD
MEDQKELIKVDLSGEVPLAPRISLLAMVDRFIASQDVSKPSRATYSRQLKQFTSWLTETDKVEALNTLQRQDILDYRAHLLEIRKSSYTVAGYLTSVRKFFEWLEAEKIYPNIARGVKGTRKAKGFRKDCLTQGQIREALVSIDRGGLEGLRDYALFNLLVRTGIRTIEVVRAQVGDLRQQGGEAVLWVQGKGRDAKDDFVILIDETLRPLREYLSTRGNLAETDPLFASISDRNNGEGLTTKSIRRIVKSILRRVNLNDKRLSAHSLRHTAISLSIKGGASLEQAQAMARHTDPKTTMTYFHNAARIESGAERFIQF